MFQSARIILLHKQKTSGRVRFLCMGDSVIAFQPLPSFSVLREADYSPTVHLHPAGLTREAEITLGLEEGAIEALAEFSAWVDTPQGDVPVLLGVFTAIDPPFAAVERICARFIALTESRQLSDIERELLGRAYEHVLG